MHRHRPRCERRTRPPGRAATSAITSSPVSVSCPSPSPSVSPSAPTSVCRLSSRVKETRMKAVVMHEHGGPEVLRYEDVPDPIAGPGEALVRVRACALNHLDIWTRIGQAGRMVTFPHILGNDIAGEVVSL